MKFNIIFLLALFVFSFTANSQSNRDFSEEFKQKTYFGVRTSIIVPDDILLHSKLSKTSNNTEYTLVTKPSFIFGMGVKHEFTRHYSFNVGINFVRRNYDAGFSYNDTTVSRRLKFISYEVPVTGAVHVRLSKRIYMNTSAGLMLNSFPSNIIVENIFGLKYRFMTFASVVNVGWEYRTKENGHFYLGASYKRDFENMLNVLYYKKSIIGIADEFIIARGDYISLDFIYYLPQNFRKR